MLTTCSYPSRNISQEIQCFHKICMCHSNFSTRKFSVVLHALLLQLFIQGRGHLLKLELCVAQGIHNNYNGRHCWSLFPF